MRLRTEVTYDPALGMYWIRIGDQEMSAIPERYIEEMIRKIQVVKRCAAGRRKGSAGMPAAAVEVSER